jgi:chaperone required for assembly of F1-ATPase
MMKRFYKTAAASAVGDGYGVMLDAKRLLTPAKLPLAVPSRALAEAIAEEWSAQGPELRPHTMPLMRLASTAIDLVARRHAETVAEIAAYAETDLLCYRADQPSELAARQHAAWQPLLDWATLRYDAPLIVTAGIIPVTQPPATLHALAVAVAAYDPLRLTALHAVTTASGSLVIALALLTGEIDADAAFACAQLDENFQIERWGEDYEAADRRAALKADIATAARFAALLDEP